jgi:Ca2+-binding EF-hand superfamily protein
VNPWCSGALNLRFSCRRSVNARNFEGRSLFKQKVGIGFSEEGMLTMRFRIIALASCFIGLGSSWLLADENGNDRPQRSATFRNLLERFDRDGDGRLNDQERQEARSAMEQRRQRDGGQNRTGQNRTGQNRTGQNRTGQNRTGRDSGNRSNRGASSRSRLSSQQRSELLKRFDVNKNGKLDPPELTRAKQAMSRGANGSNSRSRGSSGNSRMSREELLKRFDANRNGRIDGEELQKARSSFGRSDRGSDQPAASSRGRLDREELMKRFDLDGNGRLDAEEREQAFAAMRKKKEK